MDIGPARHNEPPHYQLLLFVSGDTPSALRAQESIRSLCDRWDKGCELQVIDVLCHRDQAVAYRIYATPTLLMTAPRVVRIVGDFSDANAVLAALGLTSP
jgi:circadian clock protein KaiB